MKFEAVSLPVSSYYYVLKLVYPPVPLHLSLVLVPGPGRSNILVLILECPGCQPYVTQSSLLTHHIEHTTLVLGSFLKFLIVDFFFAL